MTRKRTKPPTPPALRVGDDGVLEIGGLVRAVFGTADTWCRAVAPNDAERDVQRHALAGMLTACLSVAALAARAAGWTREMWRRAAEDSFDKGEEIVALCLRGLSCRMPPPQADESTELH